MTGFDGMISSVISALRVWKDVLVHIRLLGGAS